MQNCDICGDRIESEGAVLHEKYRETLCDDCYRERYQFTCCWCCDYGENADQHSMIVVLDDSIRFSFPVTGDYVPVGIYQILAYPYFGSDYLSSWLIESAVKKIAEIPGDGIDEYFYPCGHLCAKCQQKVILLEKP